MQLVALSLAVVAAVAVVTVALLATPQVAVAVGAQAVLAHLPVQQAAPDIPQLAALSRQAVKAVVVPFHLAAARVAPLELAAMAPGTMKGPGVVVVVDGVRLAVKVDVF